MNTFKTIKNSLIDEVCAKIKIQLCLKKDSQTILLNLK